jgi:hypothetical protein
MTLGNLDANGIGRYDNPHNTIGLSFAGLLNQGLNSVSGALTNNAGYSLRQVQYRTASGTFDKALYPWLRAVRVRLVGGGAAGGGATATPANASSKGGGGGGGGYAEQLITDIINMPVSQPFTVGNGGNGVVGGIGNDGFATFWGSLTGNGGSGGNIPSGGTTDPTVVALGGLGGSGVAGQFAVPGGPGRAGFTFNVAEFRGLAGDGGQSVYSSGARGLNVSSTGAAAGGFGGGGAGAYGAQSNIARAGGAGSPGIVIVELFSF